SPRIKPRRSLEKGRQVSGDTTRIASHALSRPKANGASLPPVIAACTWPLRTSQNACPMAWFAEEHAVETVNTGPEIPNSIEMWRRIIAAHLGAVLEAQLGIIHRLDGPDCRFAL